MAAWHQREHRLVLRQYFPKGTDLARHSTEDLEAVANTLNAKPRETLRWRTPTEALDEHLQLIQQSSVATTSGMQAREGKVYCCCVLDTFSRRIVTLSRAVWSMSITGSSSPHGPSQIGFAKPV